MIGRGGGGGLRCASGAVAWCVGGLPEVLLFQVVNVESEGVNGPPGFAGRLSALRGGCAPGVPAPSSPGGLRGFDAPAARLPRCGAEEALPVLLGKQCVLVYNPPDDLFPVVRPRTLQYALVDQPDELVA